ncbi:MAG: histidine phosphatase family protein [Nitrospirota bacterium]
MDCLLFRHGLAVDREEWKGPEPERPLTARGIEKTRQAVRGLVKLGITPTHLLASPFVRALETARLIREVSRARVELQACEELVPDAPPDKLLPLLANLPEDACVICVGHEPHLGEAAGVMLFGKPVGGLSLKKAGACCVRFERGPKIGQGLLRWWLTPSQLRELGKT